MTPDRDRLARLLGGDVLVDLRHRLQKRFATSDTPADAFTLANLSDAERDVLAGLLGRARSGQRSLRLSHAALDEALRRAGLAPDLRAALEALDGPIVDTRAAKARRAAAWAEVFARVEPSLTEFVREPAHQGLVKRLAGQDTARAAALLTDADRVLVQLPSPGTARAHLAATTLGNAHALDNGQPVATLIRRVLGPAREQPRMRDLWAEQGVLVNELAKPVATLNLATTGHSASDKLIQAAATAGEPLHLSLRLLLRATPSWQPDQTLHVCENPEILAAAADALGPACPPIICIDGQLSAAPRTLLDQLTAAGAKIHYHGDFDWPGLTIANTLHARYGFTPWRFTAADYCPDHGPALAGPVVEARWDSELMARMREAGIAIHEESELEVLLADLGR